jgi:hypothetical protein
MSTAAFQQRVSIPENKRYCTCEGVLASTFLNNLPR